MLINLLIVFLAVLFIRFIIIFSKYIQCKHYFDEYKKFIEDGGWQVTESSLQIIKLFRDAGVEDTTVSHVEEIGYGHLQSYRPSVFRNISNKRVDIVNIVLAMFHKAIGTYRNQMIETINPIFWIETVIFLPRQFLSYLGVSPDNLASKILQTLYWLFGVLFGLYKIELATFLKDWIFKHQP